MWALGFYLSVTALSETCLKWNSKISPKAEKVKALTLIEAVFEPISLILFWQRFERKENSWSLQRKVNVVPFEHWNIRWTSWTHASSIVCILISSLFCFCSSKEWALKAHSCNSLACIKENFNIGTLRLTTDWIFVDRTKRKIREHELV